MLLSAGMNNNLEAYFGFKALLFQIATLIGAMGLNHLHDGSCKRIRQRAIDDASVPQQTPNQRRVKEIIGDRPVLVIVREL